MEWLLCWIAGHRWLVWYQYGVYGYRSCRRCLRGETLEFVFGCRGWVERVR